MTPEQLEAAEAACSRLMDAWEKHLYFRVRSLHYPGYREAESAVVEAIRLAREAGLTWRDIGHALDVTATSAHDWWKRRQPKESPAAGRSYWRPGE